MPTPLTIDLGGGRSRFLAFGVGPDDPFQGLAKAFSDHLPVHRVAGIESENHLFPEHLALAGTANDQLDWARGAIALFDSFGSSLDYRGDQVDDAFRQCDAGRRQRNIHQKLWPAFVFFEFERRP